jgi:hypothetical protein
MAKLKTAIVASLSALVVGGCSVPFGTSALTTGSIAQALADKAPAESQPAVAHGATAVVPGHTSRVFTMAGLGRDCSATQPPKITIDKVPAKGSLTFSAVEPTVIQYSLSGACIGKRVAATGVYYTPRAGETGADTFVVTAHAGARTKATRKIDVNISE